MDAFNGVYYVENLTALLEGLGVDADYWMNQPPDAIRELGEAFKGDFTDEHINMDLVYFTRRLVRELRKTDPDNGLTTTVLDYLTRNNLNGSITR